MTVKQMYEKYEKLRKQGYETITIEEVLIDLIQIKRKNTKSKGE